MKKALHRSGIFLGLALLMSLMPMSVYAAEGDVEISETNFPDAVFREKWVRTYDTDEDGYLSAEEIAVVETMDCSNLGLASLQGIEYFTALKELNCSYNQLTSLDVSSNSMLISLECSYNQLSSLDLSQNSELENVSCFGNIAYIDLDSERRFDLSSLPGNFDVAKAGEWVGGTVNGNILTVNPGESEVYYTYNTGNGTVDFCLIQYVEPVEINETNFPDAVFRENYVRTYDTDGDGYLNGQEIAGVIFIDCAGQEIESLKGIEYFAGLKYLYCSNNQLTSLDVSSNTALCDLFFADNQLTSLDVSKNISLQGLDCDNNYLTSLDVSSNTALMYLYCSNNQLTSLDVRNNLALKDLYCPENQLTSLDVSKCTALMNLYCYSNQLTSLNVSKNIALEYLCCYDNQLKSLDVSRNTSLCELDCSNNQLTSLDVSQNTELEYLICTGNETQIIVKPSRTFDLTTLPGSFDVTKAGNWVGGTVDGNTLTVEPGAEEVTYDYDTGYSIENFILNVKVEGGQLSTPVLTSVTNSDQGVTVKWGAVPGAAQYRVFYKTSSGKWVGVGNTTDTTYTVTGLTGGTKYSFTVRCVSADGKTFTSAYDTTGKSITYVAQPAISSLSITSTGISVKWGAVPGASKYRLYYKNGSSWTKVTDTTGTSYTVTGLTKGTDYTFTVKAFASDGTSSSYDAVGKSIRYLAQPAISSLTNTSNGVTVKWGAVTGAEKYRLYYKTGSGSWTKVADTTGTSYTVTGLTGGTKYAFTVRCLSADGKTFTSYYDTTGKSITYVGQPAISFLTNTSTGVTVKWGAVTGAAKYRLYYKTESGSWTKVTDIIGTSCTVTGLTKGTSYTFTVKAFASDGTASSYDTVGKTITYDDTTQLAKPVLSLVANGAKGVTVKWNVVTGAVKYRVFYKTASGSWTKAGDTTGTSYTVTGLTGGTKYTFTVRCLSADGKTYTSSYDTTGKTITYVGQPAISSLTNTSTGVTVKWGAVTGTAKYRLYYKTGSGSWTKVTDTTGTSYTVTGLTKGTAYTFTVKAFALDGTASSYDTAGKTITYNYSGQLATPVLSSVANTSTGVTVKWNAVNEAAQYRVFYKTEGGSWTRAGDTTGTSYTVTGLTGGTKYTFTVRCLSADGKSFTSSYNTTGKSITYLEMPVVGFAGITPDTITLEWEAVDGAAKYRVYYKDASGSWTKLADVTGTSYTVEGISMGTMYTFTIKAFAEDGSASAYDNNGKSLIIG